LSDNTRPTRRRRNAIIAGAAGFALLLGGSTYALWSDTADLRGGMITSGNLAVTPGTFAAYDISADRLDSAGGTEIIPNTGLKGHTVTLTANGAQVADADWRIVPGDEAALVFPYTVTLVGDNLLADLKINASSLDAANANGDVSFQYAVYNASTGAVIVPLGDLPADDTTPIATFASFDADKGGGVADAIADTTVGSNGTLGVSLVLFATFDQAGVVDVGDPNAYVNTLTDLSGNLTATLEQVRLQGVNGGGQFSTPRP